MAIVYVVEAVVLVNEAVVIVVRLVYGVAVVGVLTASVVAVTVGITVTVGVVVVGVVGVVWVVEVVEVSWKSSISLKCFLFSPLNGFRTMTLKDFFRATWDGLA